MTGGEFGVTVTVRALDVDPQLSEHVTVSVYDDVPPNVGLFASSTVYVDAAKFNVNMALVGELDIVHVYGSVSVTARVCRVRLPASPAATLEVAGRLVMSGGVFACTLTVNTPVEAVPSEHCNVRAYDETLLASREWPVFKCTSYCAPVFTIEKNVVVGVEDWMEQV